MGSVSLSKSRRMLSKSPRLQASSRLTATKGGILVLPIAVVTMLPLGVGGGLLFTSVCEAEVTIVSVSTTIKVGLSVSSRLEDKVARLLSPMVVGGE